jgi:hypothetical protein
MKNFAKGTAFFVFGVLLSPIMLGVFTPLVIWNNTQNPIATMVGTAVYLAAWAMARESMIARKWHYHL